MKRGRNYKDLQSRCDNYTFSQYAGRPIDDDLILKEFKEKRSIFYDDTMEYDVVFNSKKNSQLQPVFVIREFKYVEDKQRLMGYFYGIQGFMWMSPSVFSLVKNRVQDSLSGLTQSKADELNSEKPYDGMLFKIMNYKYDLSEIEKEMERFNDKKLLEEEEEDDDSDYDEEEEEEEENEEEETPIKKQKKE